MPEYTLVCSKCHTNFDRFSWHDLDDRDRVCPNCQSNDTTVQWVIEQPFEDLASFGCA